MHHDHECLIGNDIFVNTGQQKFQCTTYVNHPVKKFNAFIFVTVFVVRNTKIAIIMYSISHN